MAETFEDAGRAATGTRSPDGANGSRECAPDDRLRAIRVLSAERFPGYASLHPGYETQKSSADGFRNNLDKYFQHLRRRSIRQIGASQAHRNSDFAERMRDWGAELGDANGNGLDQCEASQQADRNGLA